MGWGWVGGMEEKTDSQLAGEQFLSITVEI